MVFKPSVFSFIFLGILFFLNGFQALEAFAYPPHVKDYWKTAPDVELTLVGKTHLSKLYRMFDARFKGYNQEGVQIVVDEVKWCNVDPESGTSIRSSPKQFGRCVEKLLQSAQTDEKIARKTLDQMLVAPTPRGSFLDLYSRSLQVSSTTNIAVIGELNRLVNDCTKSGVPLDEVSYLLVYGDCRSLSGTECPLPARLKKSGCEIPKELSVLEICQQNEACLQDGRAMILWGYFPWFATHQSPAMLEDFLVGLDIITTRWALKRGPVALLPAPVPVTEKPVKKGPIKLKPIHIRLVPTPEKDEKVSTTETPAPLSSDATPSTPEKNPSVVKKTPSKTLSNDPKLDARIQVRKQEGRGYATKLNCTDENIQKNRAKLTEKVPTRIEHFSDFKVSQNRLKIEVEIYICGIYKYYQDNEDNPTSAVTEQPEQPRTPVIPLVPSVLISTVKDIMDLGNMITSKAIEVNKARVKLYIEDQLKPARKREGYEDPGSPNLLEAFHQVMNEGRLTAALAVMSANLDLIREQEDGKRDEDSLWGADGERVKETFQQFEKFIQDSYSEKFGSEKRTLVSDIKILAKMKATADSPKVYLMLKELGDWRNQTLRAGLRPWLEKLKKQHPEWLTDFPAAIVGSL